MPTAVISTNSNAAGGVDIVAGVASQRIRVLGIVLVAAGTVTVTIRSGTTALTGAMTLGTSNSLQLPPSNSLDPLPLLVLNSSDALNLLLGGAVQVSGWVVYDTIGV